MVKGDGKEHSEVNMFYRVILTLITLLFNQVVISSQSMNSWEKISSDKGRSSIAMTIPPYSYYEVYQGEKRSLTGTYVHNFFDSNSDVYAQAWVYIEYVSAEDLHWLSFDSLYQVETKLAGPMGPIHSTFNSTGTNTGNIFYSTIYIDATNLEVGKTYYFKLQACSEAGGGTVGTRTCVKTATDSVKIIANPLKTLRYNSGDNFELLSPKCTFEEIPVETELFPEFLWKSAFVSSESSGVEYNLFVSKDPYFGDTLINIVTTDTSYSHSTPLNEDEKYYWKVLAINNQLDSIWSSGKPYSFVTNLESNSPSGIQVLPRNNDLVNVEEFTISWKSDFDSDLYDVQVYRIEISSDSLFNSLDRAYDLFNTNNWVVTALELGTYFWRIIDGL